MFPQVKLSVWYLLPGRDQLLHRLLKILQASEFLPDCLGSLSEVCTGNNRAVPSSPNTKALLLGDFRWRRPLLQPPPGAFSDVQKMSRDVRHANWKLTATLLLNAILREVVME